MVINHLLSGMILQVETVKNGRDPVDGSEIQLMEEFMVMKTTV